VMFANGLTLDDVKAFVRKEYPDYDTYNAALKEMQSKVGV